MEKVKLKRFKVLPKEYSGIMEKRYFAQFNVYVNNEIKCCNITNENIDLTTAEVSIKAVRLIDTIEGTSIEGQHLTGKKLVILGDVNTKVYYDCYKNQRRCIDDYAVCCLKRDIPFSTYIVVPNPICDKEPINLIYDIEDATSIMIDNNKLFISVTLIIEFLDNY